MAGESAQDRARRSREKAAKLLADAENWERGAEGEARTAQVLAGLGPGWTVWHDLVWPGRKHANIDHLVIGPTGIFVVDSKHWSGAITIKDEVLRQNGYRREREVAGCDESAIAVGSLVPDVIALCHPVLCFVRDEAMRDSVRGVAVCSTSTLVATIVNRPVVLDAAQVHHVAARLHAQMASKPSAAAAHAPRQQPQRAAQPARSRRPARASTPRSRRGRRSPVAAFSRLVVGVFGMLIGLSLLLTLVQGLADSIAQPPTVAPTESQTVPAKE
jgi:hypothetical protein